MDIITDLFIMHSCLDTIYNHSNIVIIIQFNVTRGKSGLHVNWIIRFKIYAHQRVPPTLSTLRDYCEYPKRLE